MSCDYYNLVGNVSQYCNDAIFNNFHVYHDVRYYAELMKSMKNEGW